MVEPGGLPKGFGKHLQESDSLIIQVKHTVPKFYMQTFLDTFEKVILNYGSIQYA